LTFNDELARDAAALTKKYGIEIIVVNTNSLFNKIVANPKAYGFSNVKDAGWCGTDDVPTCTSHNPNNFLFWDELHPTTAANQILASFAATYVAGQF
jgi:outer membrane lipase/esterase